MIDPRHIGLSVIYSGPVVASLLMLAKIAVCLLKSRSAGQKRLYLILGAFLCCIAINWSFILLYIFDPPLYTKLNLVCYFTFPATQVVLFHFIYQLTRMPAEKPLPKIHYIVVSVMVLIFAIWSAAVPPEIRYYIVASRGEAPPGYEIYTRIFTARIPIKAVYSIIYTALAWIRLLRYRSKVADYSADTHRSALGWVNLLLGLTASLLLCPMLGFFLSIPDIIRSLLPGLAVIPIAVQLVVLCYNIVSGNYVILYLTGETEGLPRPARDPASTGRTAPAVSSETATKEEERTEQFRLRFEKLLSENKPYLNPGLRLSDLAEMLCTNRSFLSSFINRTYGISFSRYINLLRIREMDRLRARPEYEDASTTTIALSAGFSSYRSYRMFMRSEEQAGNAAAHPA